MSAPVSNPFSYTAMLTAEEQKGQGWCLTSVIPVLTLRQKDQEVKVIESELSAPPWSEGRESCKQYWEGSAAPGSASTSSRAAQKAAFCEKAGRGG